MNPFRYSIGPVLVAIGIVLWPALIEQTARPQEELAKSPAGGPVPSGGQAVNEGIPDRRVEADSPGSTGPPAAETASPSQGRAARDRQAAPVSEPPAFEANDPFANTPVMVQQAETNQLAGSRSFGLAGSLQMSLKGYVSDEHGAALALLEVGNQGVFVVRQGDAISLRGRGGQGLLKVTEITPQGVGVEFGALGQSLTVR